MYSHTANHVKSTLRRFATPKPLPRPFRGVLYRGELRVQQCPSSTIRDSPACERRRDCPRGRGRNRFRGRMHARGHQPFVVPEEGPGESWWKVWPREPITTSSTPSTSPSRSVSDTACRARRLLRPDLLRRRWVQEVPQPRLHGCAARGAGPAAGRRKP